MKFERGVELSSFEDLTKKNMLFIHFFIFIESRVDGSKSFVYVQFSSFRGKSKDFID